jgi:hypothetical protein
MRKHKTNRAILNRYERSDDKHFFLDVAATNVTDLFNSYDKHAPFVRRDLDEDLVGYLTQCAGELRSEQFVIRLTLKEPPDDQKFARVQTSIAGYFDYLIEKEQQDSRRRLRRSTLLVLIGIGILFASVIVERNWKIENSVLFTVLSQGLTILAWVAIWEALAMLALDWFPFHRRVSIYRKLAAARVALRLQPHPHGDSGTTTG